MDSALPFISFIPLAIWVSLTFFRDNFWQADQIILSPTAELETWLGVVTIIPARNEALSIGAAVSSLLAQDYPGELLVFVVDDNSDDETAGTARSAAGNNTAKLYIISEMPLAGGWSGKLWAINQDIEASQNLEGSFKYILLTDADIIHTPGNLRWLVGKAEISVLDLVSKMVMLRCQSFWKKTINSSLRFLFPKALPISSG